MWLSRCGEGLPRLIKGKPAKNIKTSIFSVTALKLTCPDPVAWSSSSALVEHAVQHESTDKCYKVNAHTISTRSTLWLNDKLL